jgi:hypothetical protein
LIQSTILLTSALLFISVIFVTIFILDRRDEKHADPHRAERQRSKQSRALSLVWRPIRWAFGTAVALVSLAASIYGILGGPFWPTEPRFSPGPPSLRLSFEVPFTVTNESKIFSIYHLNISCVLLKIIMVGPSNVPVTFQNSVMTSHIKNQVLWAGDSSPYKCTFRHLMSLGGQDVADFNVKEAYINFISEYESPWSGLLTKSKSTPFTLVTSSVPMYWTVGFPLR